jgi:uncharacterized protein
MSAFALSSWSLEKKLAAAALLLGAVAVVGNPYRGTGVVSLDTRELAAIVQGEVDHVTPGELADWIVQGRNDYRLIDLRDEAAYAAYHVPTAERAPITALTDYPLQRNEKIVLYSDGGIHAAQAWFLLKAEGYSGAITLLGGLDGWKEEVLFPEAPADPTPEQSAAFARAREVSAFFGGTPRAAGADGSAVAAPELPAVAMPAPQAAPVAVAVRKKRKEGC